MMKGRLRRFFLTLLNFFYPPICVGCEKEIEEGFLCFACYEKLFVSSLAVCPKCGRPVPHFSRCRECQPKLHLVRIRALGLYAPPFKGIIEEFKYKGKKKLGKVLGDALSLLLSYDPILKRGDILVPIPLHPAKIRERGYNQSEMLAREIARQTNLPCSLCLKRIRNTKSQVKLSSPKERFRNMENVFAVGNNPEVIKGKKVILVDDVLTSGATLSSAARVLLEGGAEEVYGLVVAKG